MLKCRYLIFTEKYNYTEKIMNLIFKINSNIELIP